MYQKIITSSSEETKNIAREFSVLLRGGDLVFLEGDLGAGKTTFAQGLLEALGAEGPFTSPTFTIVKTYNLPNTKSDIHKAYHIDAYRIDKDALPSIGWDDMMNDGSAVTIVEWPERIMGAIPERAKTITFRWVSEHEREITR